MSDKESDTKPKDNDVASKSRVIVEQSNAVEAGAELSVSSSGAEASSTVSLSPQPGPSSSSIMFSDLKKVQLISDEDIQYFLEDNAYAVVPVADCPHMSVIQPLPVAEINIKAPCTRCESTQENWICLTCYAVYCSRYVNQHMVEHTQAASHPIALSFSDISVWCYSCDDYVESDVLHQVKSVVHQAKFGIPS